jgi:hypothetical protein
VSRTSIALVSAAALPLFFAPPAAAQSSAVIYACLNPGNASVRIVDVNEACKATETRLQWNVVGTPGPMGPQGESGLQGARGEKGDQGLPGEFGPRGDQGAKGDKGEKGDPGPSGLKGDTGAAGAQGPAGAQGDLGSVGPAGPQGAQGDVGPAGQDGAPGEPGATGAQGPQGAEGPSGPSGFITGMKFESTNSNAFLGTAPSNLGGACATGTYVAGANEVATVSLDVMAFQSGPPNTLLLAPMAIVNGAPPQFLVSFLSAAALPTSQFVSMHSGTTVPLAAGSTYRFASGLRTAAVTSFSELNCRGVVTIFKRP